VLRYTCSKYVFGFFWTFSTRFQYLYLTTTIFCIDSDRLKIFLLWKWDYSTGSIFQFLQSDFIRISGLFAFIEAWICQNRLIFIVQNVFNPSESKQRIVVLRNKYWKRVENIRKNLKTYYEHIWKLFHTELQRISENLWMPVEGLWTIQGGYARDSSVRHWNLKLNFGFGFLWRKRKNVVFILI